jgi:hypothetical protein
MQLDADAGSIRRKLIAASCALLGGAPAARAGENAIAGIVNHALDGWQVDSALAYYREDGRIQAIEPVISAVHQLSDDGLLALDFTFDSLSGSSPNGALPSRKPQTFASPSAKSFAQARHIYAVSPGRLPVDPNYSDGRAAGGIDWTLPLSRLLRTTLGARFSYEDDFFSATVHAALERDFNDKNTTVSLGVNSENDFLQPIGGAPAPLSDYNRFDKEGHKSKHGAGALLGVTQIMTRGWLTQVNLSLDRFSGYLNDPYKIVSVLDATGSPAGYVYENRPETRTRRSIYLENRVGWSRASVVGSLRYMTDSWGIHSDTAQLKVRWWNAGRDQYFEPTVRWYRQNGADFFHPFVPADALLQPTDVSADSRLAPFHALTYGLKYGMHLAGLPLGFGRESTEFSVRLEYYQQTLHVAPTAPVGLQGLDLYPDLKAVLLQVGFSY